MDIPLVSVVVPVYNVEDYMLSECFNSILTQGYPNIELIIVDDGSNEKTKRWLDSFCKSHNEIVLIHIPNGGASVARNKGIDKATGEYITFIDADDWIDKEYISTLVDNFDTETDIVMCSRVFEYLTYKRENSFFSEDKLFDVSNKEELIHKSITSGIAGTWCKMYRMSFLSENNLRYDSRLRRTQDIIFNLYAFQNASSVKYINKCIYHYRMQNGSVTKKYNTKADIILTPAASEFVNFVNRYYDNNEQIKSDLYYKCITILNEICKLKVFNPEYINSVDRNNRYSLISELVNLSVYKSAIDSYPIMMYPSVLGRIKLCLLKRKKYRLLYQIYRFQLFVEHRRNF